MGGTAVITAVAGVLRYSGRGRRARLRRRDARPRRAGLGGRARHRAGRRCASGRRSPGFMQSTLGNLPEFFIVLFALQLGRGGGRADLADRLDLRQRPARARTGDRRGVDHGPTTAACASAARLPQDTATLLFVSRLRDRDHRALDRVLAIRRATTIEGLSIVGAVCLLVVYGAWAWGYLRSDTASRASAGRGDQPRLSFGVAVVLLAMAGVGAAFVSDWFIHALDPAVDVARHLQGVRRPGDRRHRRQRGRELHRDLPRRQGQVRPRDLGREELGGPDRRLPLPGAGAHLAALHPRI